MEALRSERRLLHRTTSSIRSLTHRHRSDESRSAEPKCFRTRQRARHHRTRFRSPPTRSPTRFRLCSFWFDQPLYPGTANISPNTIELGFDDGQGNLIQVPTRVQLLENCGLEGSTVLITPLGVLPTHVELALEIKRELRDLGDERNLANIRPLRLQAQAIGSVSLDAFHEGFDDDLLEDEKAAFASARARWGEDSQLRPAPPFEGRNQDFIWEITGTVNLDTSFDRITNSTNSQSLPIVNGIVDVHDVIITASGVLRGVGPNPLVVLASGSVTIDGEVTVNGVPTDGNEHVCVRR